MLGFQKLLILLNFHTTYMCTEHIICPLSHTRSTCNDDGGAVAHVGDEAVFYGAVINARIGHTRVIDESCAQAPALISVNSRSRVHLSTSTIHFKPDD